MTTPQNPGDGDTPQDPSDPQNPYGTPPAPPSPPSSPPPSSPPPAAPPAPYAPSAPPSTPIPAIPPANPMPVQYGDPSSGSAMPPPAPPYDAAGNAQPAYPQAGPMPGVPGAPGAPGAPTEPGKGMAITALVLSFICCLDVVGMILAIVVLVRSRDGQNRGKGLAIAALIVGFITLVITIVLVVAGVSYVKDFKDVNDLKAGDCITAHGLTDKNADTIDQIRSVSCSSKHDGEVLATTSVTADLAKDISKMDPQATCAPAIEAAGKSAAVTDSVNVTALTVATPKTGDNIACVAYHADGSKLTGKLG